jgi:hypothetical protein
MGTGGAGEGGEDCVGGTGPGADPEGARRLRGQRRHFGFAVALDVGEAERARAPAGTVAAWWK